LVPCCCAKELNAAAARVHPTSGLLIPHSDNPNTCENV
jgi:hypothetical protein